MNKETSQSVYITHCSLFFSPDSIPPLLSNQTSLRIAGWYQDSLPFQTVRVWLKDWNHNMPNWNTSLGLEQIKLVTWVDFCLNESYIKNLRFGSKSTQRITGTTMKFLAVWVSLICDIQLLLSPNDSNWKRITCTPNTKML